MNKSQFGIRNLNVRELAHFFFYVVGNRPYVGFISHHIENELCQFFKVQIPDAKLRFVHQTNKNNEFLL